MNFSLKRFGRLIIREFLQRRLELMLGAPILFLVVYFVKYFFLPEEPQALALVSKISLFSWFVLGILGASRAFRTLHLKAEGLEYLLLPASMLEKSVSKMVFSLIAIPMGIFIVSAFATLAVELRLSLIAGGFNTGYPLVFVDRSLFLQKSIFIPAWAFLGIFTAQSVFLLGGIWFCRHPLLKTLLFFGALSLTSGAYLILQNATLGKFLVHNSIYSIPSKDASEYLFSVLKWIPLPFCLVMTWLRLKEKQNDL